MPPMDAPTNTQRTSRNNAPNPPIEEPQISEIDKLKQANLKLKTENRWLRVAIRELGIANDIAGAEKRLTETRIGIFEKIDAESKLVYNDAQYKARKAWVPLIHDIFRKRQTFDTTRLWKDREEYESAVASWQMKYTRRDDLEVLFCYKALGDQLSKLDIQSEALEKAVKNITSENSELSAENIKLKRNSIEQEKKLKVQASVLSSLQEREKDQVISIVEMKSKHEREMKEQGEVIESLKEKEKLSVTELNSEYTAKLKEQKAVIANLQQRTKTLETTAKKTYEKKLAEQRIIIANLEEKEESAATQTKIEYEEKLKEQESTIAKLHQEKLASAAEMQRVGRELAAHREVSVSILNRKRELTKPHEIRNDHLIETGNISAHGGTCLADVFRIKSNPDINEQAWFQETYGVSVDTAERYGESAAFVKLINMRYELYRCSAENRDVDPEFEEGFQKLLTGSLEKNEKVTPASIDKFLLESKVGRDTFQRLCSIWDITRVYQRRQFRESRDPKRKSIFGGSFKSVKSNASVWTAETQRRSKLDQIEEYGKEFLSSAKDALPWTKH
ncbi:uncharacterized protein EAF01_007261 [Botrytis porri]|uniref:Uncharacterized protein n=1 Tax=Botrytis porri TaxID=87229 RepID=A0A4Z1KIY5_9HELO|nr:uncharacterized protein EAF01_007261 [Botrytis porri]KAF7901963.1 hypothetical protein EAF01_007261 [Botrytis porri]TGO85440.1 hypothetical protein BPOR_0396g00120 [Botrytis porri]